MNLTLELISIWKNGKNFHWSNLFKQICLYLTAWIYGGCKPLFSVSANGIKCGRTLVATNLPITWTSNAPRALYPSAFLATHVYVAWSEFRSTFSMMSVPLGKTFCFRLIGNARLSVDNHEKKWGEVNRKWLYGSFQKLNLLNWIQSIQGTVYAELNTN